MQKDPHKKLPYSKRSEFSHAVHPPTASASIEPPSANASDPAQTPRSKLTITHGWWEYAPGALGCDDMSRNSPGMLLDKQATIIAKGREGF